MEANSSACLRSESLASPCADLWIDRRIVAARELKPRSEELDCESVGGVSAARRLQGRVYAKTYSAQRPAERDVSTGKPGTCRSGLADLTEMPAAR